MWALGRIWRGYGDSQRNTIHEFTQMSLYMHVFEKLLWYYHEFHDMLVCLICIIILQLLPEGRVTVVTAINSSVDYKYSHL